MTSAGIGATDELVVVHVSDAVNAVLSGRQDVSYQTPPLRPEEALKLVGMLLGRGCAPDDGEVSWRCPIAGGRRTITIEPLDEFETPAAKDSMLPEPQR